MDTVKAPRWVWATLAGVAVLSIGSSAKTSYDTRETNDKLVDTQKCQTAFIAENSRVSKIRAQANIKREAAVNDLLNGVASLTLNVAQTDEGKAKAERKYRSLFEDYQRTTAEVAVERAKNPLPDLPASCSDLD